MITGISGEYHANTFDYTEIASAEHHEHIEAMLDARMNKRKGVAMM